MNLTHEESQVLLLTPGLVERLPRGELSAHLRAVSLGVAGECPPWQCEHGRDVRICSAWHASDSRPAVPDAPAADGWRLASEPPPAGRNVMVFAPNIYGADAGFCDRHGR